MVLERDEGMRLLVPRSHEAVNSLALLEDFVFGGLLAITLGCLSQNFSCGPLASSRELRKGVADQIPSRVVS